MRDDLSTTIQRRHDLDALRAFAMLLGIALHASLSFAPFPWMVQDSQQNSLFSLFFLAVHGFRMPLFFVVSGFFTAMLWRRRGLSAMLRQRTLRIFIPCMLGLITIIPLTDWVSDWALRSSTSRPLLEDDGSLVAAIRRKDHAAVLQRLEAAEAKINEPEGQYGVTPIAWAALAGDAESVRILLDHGADLNARNRDGSTALHSAAFLGRTDVVQLLLERGADPNARSDDGERPLEGTKVDWGATQFIAGLLHVPLEDRADVERNREEILGVLTPVTASKSGEQESKDAAGDQKKSGDWLKAYQDMISSDRLSVNFGDKPFHLVSTPVFSHLWFLWFLCWLVPIFAVYAWCSDYFRWSTLPRGLILSPVRWIWLLPVTLLPQWFMGIGTPSFGPDTSSGILPAPHILLYYAVFFAFGALYFDAQDDEGRLGRWWWLSLPLSLLIVLPVGTISMGYRPLSSVAQVLYAWGMTFGLMGLFRRLLRRESRAIRYVSDSSYWLYVTHLPFVVAAQAVVQNWPLPASVKFSLICIVTFAFLLTTYQVFVRYTLIGRMLNGPRVRMRPHDNAMALVPSEPSTSMASVGSSSQEELDALYVLKEST
jgi:peptidoglycan/LPS O-acetylase OafA/YrhL